MFAYEISEDKHYLLIKFQHSRNRRIVSEPQRRGADFMENTTATAVLRRWSDQADAVFAFSLSTRLLAVNYSHCSVTALLPFGSSISRASPENVSDSGFENSEKKKKSLEFLRRGGGLG